MDQLTQQFTQVLHCKEPFVQARLIALGHKTTCGRCGGSGHYSFCQQHGTTCFGCNGRGLVATELSVQLLETVQTQVQAGELQPYLDQLKLIKAAKQFDKTFFDTWKNLPSVADERDRNVPWMQASQRVKDINSLCSRLFDKVKSSRERVMDGYLFEDGKKRVITQEELKAALLELDQALETVRQAEKLVTT